MRFNSTLGVEFDKWSQVKMERENNMREFKGTHEEEHPKFGAGSEFGREAKEEARRKKLGIIPKKYKPDNQPWILKSSGSTVKKFKGIREGGVSENAAYYVFTHAANNVIQAFPLNEWYKFQPIQRYKALSAEEAEQEFSKRNQHLNFFSLMLRKRLKGEDDTVLDGEGEDGKGKGKKTSKSKELKISEMDEWMETSDDDSDDEEDGEKQDDEDKADKKKKKGKKLDVKKKKKKRDTDGEAFEDSDDGDGEGRELDYITDSSDSEPETSKLEGVADEKGLKKLLNSDEEEDSDSDKSEKDENDEDKEKSDEKEDKPKESSKSKSKKSKKDSKKDDKKDKKDDNSDFSSDSSTDEEVTKKKAAQKSKKNKGEKPAEEKPKPEKEVDSPNSSRSGSPTLESNKRKMDGAVAGGSGLPQKKSKMEPVVNYIPGASESGITEDAVRKYLMRKPMTTTELLQKFKSKKTGLSSEQLVNIMTQILKKINPVKQMLKGKMYLSIKS